MRDIIPYYHSLSINQVDACLCVCKYVIEYCAVELSISGTSQPVEHDERDQFSPHLSSPSQRYYTDTLRGYVSGGQDEITQANKAIPYKSRSRSQDEIISPTRTRQPLRIRVTKDGAHVIGGVGRCGC